MKIQPVSDLHLDCQSDRTQERIFEEVLNPQADVIIFAGDIVEARELNVLKERLGSVTKPLYYVAGNHEYWGIEYNKLVDHLKWELRHFPNVKVLENDFVVVDDVVILGGTMWTNLRNPINANMIRHYMGDFKHCTGLTTDWTNEQHEKTVKFIEDGLRMEQWRDKKKIVVTHHGPTFQAVDETYRFDTTNCGYQSHLDYILEAEWAPNIWLHGHSHVFMDKVIGNTRVIRNPFGYYDFGETTTGFKPEFLIDTDKIDEVTVIPKKVTNIWDDDYEYQ
jgi:predicted phosphodiesterase